ncbi:hypothetical protein [Rhodoblastus sp.]|uniref:hypothetical protein n=1 Tax=Rhodoblastus sp. TaxID=1962975 RepID=UPI003F9D3A8F
MPCSLSTKTQPDSRGLQQVIASVQPDEDFAPPTLLFLEADGVTPIDLTGIEFTARIGSFPPLTSGDGAITVSGSSLTFFVPAASKLWPTGKYAFSLLASDGTNTRDIFANSTLTVGAPASFVATPYGSPSSSSAIVVGGLSGASLVASVGAMTLAQMQTVADLLAAAMSPRSISSMIGNMPKQTGTEAPVATGDGFIDSSNFVVVAE